MELSMKYSTLTLEDLLKIKFDVYIHIIIY